ncbi:MAG: tetratricopeptide repeat protein, partial [Candidatus Hinthialibacter sp.]
MDLFQEGKSLAQQGDYESALDAFILAMENDKENADIHFYLGLCY